MNDFIIRCLIIFDINLHSASKLLSIYLNYSSNLFALLKRLGITVDILNYIYYFVIDNTSYAIL